MWWFLTEGTFLREQILVYFYYIFHPMRFRVNTLVLEGFVHVTMACCKPTRVSSNCKTCNYVIDLSPFFFFSPSRKQNIHQTYYYVLKESRIVEKCIMTTIWRLYSSWKTSLPTFDAFSTVWRTGFVAWNLKDSSKQFTVAASKTAVSRNAETFPSSPYQTKPVATDHF